MSITDLHICKDSITSQSDSEKSLCNCPPEFYCAEICGEGYSLSSLISWQHFPRSTSSRSLCDDSSEEIRKSISETLEYLSEEKNIESTPVSSGEYPIVKSFSQLKAFHYLKIRHIFDLLNFLIGHLVCYEPEDPVQFLVDLLDRCLKYRDSFGEPPLLFTHHHVNSLYTAFDPFERGYITLDQYEEGMKTLGLVNAITPYNATPEVNEEGFVEKNVFVFEAQKCLVGNLERMFRIPKLWEESRSTWEKRMMKDKAKKPEDGRFEAHLNKMEENLGEHYCTCSGGEPMKNLICRCVTSAEFSQEPQQLFLNDFSC